MEKLISIGTSIKESNRVLKTAREYDEVSCTVGVYPHEDIGKSMEEIYQELTAILNSSRKKIVGIGECGLDIPEGEVSYKTRDLAEQEELFKLQVGLAVKKGLPVVIHNRNANRQVIETLKFYKHTNLRGVAHCYTSDWEFAKELLHLNICISFSGIITYPSADKSLLDAVKKVPESNLLIETDAPYLSPQGHRGEVNYPKYVRITAEKIAEIRNSSYGNIEKISSENTRNLFNL